MENKKATANIAHPSNNSKGSCKKHSHVNGNGHNTGVKLPTAKFGKNGHKNGNTSYYLEPHAIPYSQNHSFYNHTLKSYVPQCIQGFSNFLCKVCMVTFFRVHLCNKEWCLTCGENESWAHKRRYHRWWDRWEQLMPLGYLIITTPIELRKYMLSLKPSGAREVLQHLRRYWVRKLKAEFDNIKGLCRYHWCGEDGKEWAPHLNFLFNRAFIHKSVLNRWRGDYYQWIKDTYNITVKAGTTNIHYRYYLKRTDRIHKLKYVTRATLKVYNKQYAEIIKGFKNNISFGKFDKPKANKKALASLEACRCPDCHCKLEHIEFIKPSKVYMLPGKLTEIDGGWFRHNLLDRGG